jgi:hypothetical protein
VQQVDVQQVDVQQVDVQQTGVQQVGVQQIGVQQISVRQVTKATAKSIRPIFRKRGTPNLEILPTLNITQITSKVEHYA